MTKLIVGSVIFIALFIGGIVWYQSTPGKLDSFAMCLEESNAKFYGAFWCGACNKQKAMFGKSKGLLPYIECSTPDRRGQTPICLDKDIKSYPTWEFADGEITTGILTLQNLADKTGCELPQ